MTDATKQHHRASQGPPPPIATFRYQDEFPIARDGELLTPAGHRLDLGAVAAGALVGLLLAVGGLLYQRVGASSAYAVTASDVAAFAAWGRAFFAVGVAMFACCGLAEGLRRNRIHADLMRAGFCDVEQYRRAFRSAQLRPSTEDPW